MGDITDRRTGQCLLESGLPPGIGMRAPYGKTARRRADLRSQRFSPVKFGTTILADLGADVIRSTNRVRAARGAAVADLG